MSFVAGDILIRMAADVASLRNDMRTAQGVVTDAFDKMKSAAKVLGGLFAVDQIASWTKSAIDAADKVDEFSQRVGMTAEEVSKLGLAFQMSGVDSSGLQTALVKLSKGIMENESAFTALGISVKNSNGTYKTSKEVLGEVSDFFAKLPDGVTKTALATELFGKSGADLIPVLNGGKKGLDDMGAEAERFGTVISTKAAKAAGDFNDALDLLRLRAQAATANGLSPFLPILTEIVKQFAQIGSASKDSSKDLGFWSSAFATAIETVGVLALNVVYVFRTIGGEISTWAQQLAALAKLDFNEFNRVGQEWTQKAALMRQEVDKQSEAILNARNKLKEHTAEVENAGDKEKTLAEKLAEAALRAKEKAAEVKRAAEEQAKLTKAGADYVEQVNRQLGVVMQEISLGRSLTDGEKELLKVQEMVRDGKIKLTEAQMAEVRAKIELIQKTKEENESRKELEKTQAAAAALSTKLEQAEIDKTEALRKGNVQLREQIENLSLSEREIAAREAAILRSTASDLEWQAGLEGGNYQLSEQARLLNERANLLEQGVAVKEAKAAADEWKKTTDSISDGLTDALMRGFESGKSLWMTFRDTLVNAFKTMVLQPTIKAILAPASGALGSLFSGNAMAGTGGGNLLSSLNPMSMLSSGIGSIGNGFAFGADALGSFLVNNTSGALNSLGGSLMSNAGAIGSIGSYLGGAGIGIGVGSAIAGNYKIGGMGGTTSSAIGSALGAAIAGPIGAAIGGAIGGIVNRAFGRGPKEIQEQGVVGSFAGGDAAGQAFQQWKQKGGWFRSDKSGTDLTAMNEEIGAALDAGAVAVFQQVKNYADALRLPSDALSNVTSEFRIKLTGKAAEDTAAITAALTEYETALTNQFSGSLGAFQRAGETLIETMGRLSVLSSFSESINEFGGVFSTLATSSIAARENVIALAGGIDQLMTLAGKFVTDYYTEGERAGMAAQQTINALRALGLDANTISELDTREEFRALVESLDLSTARGQEQLVALLQIAPQFAEMANYLEENNIKLDEVAKQAPTVAVLDQILPQTETTAEAVQSVAEKIGTSNERLQSIVDAVKEGNLSLTTGLQAIASASAAAAAAQAQANAIAAAAAAAATAAANAAALANAAPSFSVDVGSNLVAAGN